MLSGHRSRELHINGSAMRRALALVLVLLPAALPAASPAGPAAEAPSVTRVEPPDWWPNHSINPVRLLVYGRNLHDAEAAVSHPGVRVAGVTPHPRGSYLFVSLDIQPGAPAGAFDISIRTAGGTAAAPFALKAPLDRRGRFTGFTPDDVIYLIMPDRFSDGDAANNEPAESPGMYSRANPRAYHGGDLQGIIDRLPYLKDLGVTAIWTTPVYDNTRRVRDYEWGRNVTDYHGYGAVDFYRVEEHLGDLDKYRELADRAEALGIKLIQDQVANHSGPDHPWAADPPTPGFLNGTPQQHLNNVFDIKSLTEENPDRERVEATLRGWFANSLPDINQEDAEAARYIIQNAVWWVGTAGVDGIRQDTYPYVPRRFWPAWHGALAREFPSLTVVGEVFDRRPEVVSFFQGGRARFDGIDTRLHTLFDFPSYFAMRDVFVRDEPATKLAEVLKQDGAYTNAAVLVTFLGNHDVKRFMSEPGATMAKLRLAFTCLLTMRGTPQLYYGDEIGMRGGDDPDNRRDFPGGFPGDRRNAFTNAGRTPAERRLFDHVRALLRLRAARPALRRGAMRVLAATDTALAFARESAEERVLVVLNNSDRAARVEVPGLAAGSRWVELLPSRGGWRGRAAGGRISLPLPPRNAKILIESNGL